MSFLIHVNFPIVDVILTKVWTGGAAEETKDWLPSATSKPRQEHF